MNKKDAPEAFKYFGYIIFFMVIAIIVLGLSHVLKWLWTSLF